MKPVPDLMVNLVPAVAGTTTKSEPRATDLGRPRRQGFAAGPPTPAASPRLRWRNSHDRSDDVPAAMHDEVAGCPGATPGRLGAQGARRGRRGPGAVGVRAEPVPARDHAGTALAGRVD